MFKIKRRQVISSILAIVLLCIMLVGCTQQTSTPEQTAAAAQSESASIASATAPSSPAVPQASDAKTIQVTDMAGRTETIPSVVNKVYCAAPTAEAAMIALAPEKLAGWVNKPTDAILQYLPENVASLPVLGGWMGEKSTANIEEIIKTAPDIIIFMTSGTTQPNAGKTADTIQQKTQIPVLVVESTITQITDSLTFMGKLLGVEDRANELINYYNDKIIPIQKATAAIPDIDKVGVYYAEGADGLQTDPSGNTHAELLDFLNIKNVADVQSKSGQGYTPVSMEQVLSWNSDILLIAGGGDDLYNKVSTDPSWSQLKAVQSKKVYEVPAIPFNWFDRPPSLMRVLGTMWMAEIAYPDVVHLDMAKETKEFYSMFFHYDLTDQQVTDLLKDTPKS